MNDDRNTPKPLPDDFGMTMPGIRPRKPSEPDNFDMTTPNIRAPQQNQQRPPQAPPLPQDDFGMTMQNIPRPSRNQPNYNSPPPPPADDFGMTMQNIPRPSRNQQSQSPHNNPSPYGNQSYGNQPPDDYGMTTPNLRLPNNPYEPPANRQSIDDFDLTMQNSRSVPSAMNFDQTMPGGGRAASSNEPDFGSTQMYINVPAHKVRTFEPDPATVQAEQQKNEKKGLPLWAWLVMGGSGAMVFVAVVGAILYFLLYPATGFDLVIKGAPPRSDVYVDGSLRGVTSADGSTKVFGLRADGKRNLKVSREGFSDFNDTVLGENGSTKEVIAQMKPLAVKDVDIKPCDACKDPDPRICKAECDASVALDGLDPSFTVDDLVKAMNLQIINFETNKFDIPPQREAFLRKAAEKFKILKGNPVVEIGGHTDNVGADASNLTLSNNRAMAVDTLLKAFGVEPRMLTKKGYGESQPKNNNQTEEERFQNRRIEYRVVSR